MPLPLSCENQLVARVMQHHSYLQVISRTGKAEVLTSPHRPYGNNRTSLEEVKRIRAAGGWVRLFAPTLCYELKLRAF